MVLLAVGGVVIAVNTAIGIHDQISPENRTLLYSHFDADGDGSSPLMKSLVGSGSLGAVIWLRMRGQLRQYMQFSLRKLPPIQRDRPYSVSELVRGRSRTPLHDVTLRVVACNMELGQYKRGSGTTVRTVSFREPIRGVILYETTVDHIPAHVPIPLRGFPRRMSQPINDHLGLLQRSFASVRIIVFTGMSGSGKSTCIDLLLAEHPEFAERFRRSASIEPGGRSKRDTI